MASDHLPLAGDRIVPRNGFRWLAQRRYYLAIGALSAGVVGWNLYRACRLSITHDEALTYLYYVAKGPRGICSREGYCANNHILYSLLAWCSVQLFGVSEFALRLPSVLAGALFVVGAGRLFGQLAGRTVLAWTGVLVLTLNPLIMDFLVAARGYGLGLALSMWAWSCLVATLASANDPASRKSQILNWLAGGTAMGLAVGANLTFLFPNLALALAFLGVKLGTDRYNRGATLKHFALWFVVPGALWAVLLCYPLIRHVAAAGSSNAGGNDAHFYYGSTSFFQTTQSILVPTLQAVPENSWLPLAANDPAWTAITYGVMIAFLALLALLLLVLHRLIRNPQSRDDEWSRQYAFLAGGGRSG
jgi:4-amino-4-deoxy-L-arabinose transferase-like glycosyltransferase